MQSDETTMDIRPSACAGKWYPATETSLRAMINQFLADAHPSLPEGERAIALISPHAGYPYSGPVAAYAYRVVEGEPAERVVLVGPLHRPILIGQIGPVMVSGEAAYETPLGILPVDREFIQRLAQRVRLNVIRADEEHSLENQLPFLQATVGAFHCVPILLSLPPDDASSLARCRDLGEVLAEVVAATPGRTLLVASTDLSHLYDYQTVRAHDEVLTKLVAAFDLDGLVQALAEERVYACGGAALVTVMQAARALGATQAVPLRYATSGDVTGDKRPGIFTVGYLAAALTQPQ